MNIKGKLSPLPLPFPSLCVAITLGSYTCLVVVLVDTLVVVFVTCNYWRSYFFFVLLKYILALVLSKDLWYAQQCYNFLFWLWVTPGSAQALLLVMCLGGHFWKWPCDAQRIEPVLNLCYARNWTRLSPMQDSHLIPSSVSLALAHMLIGACTPDCSTHNF